APELPAAWSAGAGGSSQVFALRAPLAALRPTSSLLITDRPCSLLHDNFQTLPRAVEIRLHRTHRLIENRRDFLVTAFLLIVQREDDPVARAQLPQRRFHYLTHLRLLQQLRRTGRGMRQCFRRRVIKRR